ncbi:MAG: TraB/GumN family protein [Flavobacteriales bacterium]|nr:TraB/GumN family protein [Flavobacteriales bacterium]
MWQISGNGLTDTSYLYGTMHVQDKRVFDFKPNVLPAFDSAEVLALELNMDSVNPLAVMGSMIMDSSIVIADLLSPKDYQLVKSYIEDSLGIPMMLFSHLQPLFISSFIQAKSLNSEMEEALDLYFFRKAKEQNKRISGLEKVEEQIAAFNSIPYREQAVELFKMISPEDNNEDEMSTEELLDAYLSGNLDLLIDVAQGTSEEAKNDFEKTFLIDRNIVMVKRMEPLLKNHRVFIGVGAAHLPGEHGVIELLRSKGYTVLAK